MFNSILLLIKSLNIDLVVFHIKLLIKNSIIISLKKEYNNQDKSCFISFHFIYQSTVTIYFKLN